MRKITLFLSSFIILLILSGCANIREVQYTALEKPQEQKAIISVVLRNKEMGLRTGMFRSASAIYYTAKIAKEKGYNYIRFLMPKELKEMMFNNADELYECYTKATLNIFDKCARARNVNYNTTDVRYGVAAEAYKIQPTEVLTIPADDILEKFKNYDLDQKDYKIVFKPYKG